MAAHGGTSESSRAPAAESVREQSKAFMMSKETDKSRSRKTAAWENVSTGGLLHWLRPSWRVLGLTFLSPSFTILTAANSWWPNIPCQDSTLDKLTPRVTLPPWLPARHGLQPHPLWHALHHADNMCWWHQTCGDHKILDGHTVCTSHLSLPPLWPFLSPIWKTFLLRQKRAMLQSQSAASLSRKAPGPSMPCQHGILISTQVWFSKLVFLRLQWSLEKITIHLEPRHRAWLLALMWTASLNMFCFLFHTGLENSCKFLLQLLRACC